MVDHSPAIPPLSIVDDRQAAALSGDVAVAETFTFGGTTAVIGPAGTVIMAPNPIRPSGSVGTTNPRQPSKSRSAGSSSSSRCTKPQWAPTTWRSCAS